MAPSRKQPSRIRTGTVERFLQATDVTKDPSMSPTCKEAHISCSGTASMSSSSRTPTPVRTSQSSLHERRITYSPPTSRRNQEITSREDNDTSYSPRLRLFPATTVPLIRCGEETDGSSLTSRRTSETRSTRNWKQQASEASSLDSMSHSTPPETQANAISNQGVSITHMHDGLGNKSGWRRRLEGTARGMKPSPKRGPNADSSWIKKKGPSRHLGGSPQQQNDKITAHPLTAEILRERALPQPNTSHAPTEVMMNLSSKKKDSELRSDFTGAQTDIITNKALEKNVLGKLALCEKQDAALEKRISLTRQTNGEIRQSIAGNPVQDNNSHGRLGQHVGISSRAILPSSSGSFQSRSISSSVGVETGGRHVDRAPTALKRILESSPPRDHILPIAVPLGKTDFELRMERKSSSGGRATAIPHEQGIASQLKAETKGTQSSRLPVACGGSTGIEFTGVGGGVTVSKPAPAASEELKIKNPLLIKYPVRNSNNSSHPDRQETSFSDASSGWTPVVFSSTGLDMEDFQAAMRSDDGVQLLFSPDRLNQEDEIDFADFAPPLIRRSITVERDPGIDSQHVQDAMHRPKTTVRVGQQEKVRLVSSKSTATNPAYQTSSSSSLLAKESYHGAKDITKEVPDTGKAQLTKRGYDNSTAGSAQTAQAHAASSTRLHSSLVQGGIQTFVSSDGTRKLPATISASSVSKSPLEQRGPQDPQIQVPNHTFQNVAPLIDESGRPAKSNSTPVSRSGELPINDGVRRGPQNGKSKSDGVTIPGRSVSKMRSLFESSKSDHSNPMDSDELLNSSTTTKSIGVRGVDSLSDINTFSKIRSRFEPVVHTIEEPATSQRNKTVQVFESMSNNNSNHKAEMGHRVNTSRGSNVIAWKGGAHKPPPQSKAVNPSIEMNDDGEDRRRTIEAPEQREKSNAVLPEASPDHQALSISQRIKAMRLERANSSSTPTKKFDSSRISQSGLIQNGQIGTSLSVAHKKQVETKKLPDDEVDEREVYERFQNSAFASARGSPSSGHEPFSTFGTRSLISSRQLGDLQRYRPNEQHRDEKVVARVAPGETGAVSQLRYPSSMLPSNSTQARRDNLSRKVDGVQAGTQGGQFQSIDPKKPQKLAGARFLDGTSRSFSEGYDDGVTLDLSIADVSCLTNPTCLRSKEDASLEDMSSRNSKDHDVAEVVIRGPSEASSSQTSEAAAPLIALSMRTKYTNSSDDFGHFSHRSFGERLQSRETNSKWVPLAGPVEDATRVDDQTDEMSDPAWDLRKIKVRFAKRQAEIAESEKRHKQSIEAHERQQRRVHEFDPWTPFKSDAFEATDESKSNQENNDRIAKQAIDAPPTGFARQKSPVTAKGRPNTWNEEHQESSIESRVVLDHQRRGDAIVRSRCVDVESAPKKRKSFLKDKYGAKKNVPSQQTALVIRKEEENPSPRNSPQTYHKHIALMSKLNALKEARIRRNAAFSRNGPASGSRASGGVPPLQSRALTNVRAPYLAMPRRRIEAEEPSITSSTQFGGPNFEYCLDID